ncbi:(d)CMP kinase [Haladaptatus halobius]|uniref:(d)CMP kinase n=1 Tax=Haladaptatus halobius TaxID=2884875 RepID=UPI001D0A8C17|nr:AAA family ATPase [Haladaptatus halobius]
MTLSGPPASGTSTLAKMLADDCGFTVMNGGDIFRNMAEDQGMTIAEFATVAEDDPRIDREIDDRLEAEINAHLEGKRESGDTGLIVESRLAGWHANGQADLSVWLDAPVEERAQRLDERAETPIELREREMSDAQRYQDYYDIDIADLSIYDLVIDTGTLSEEGMFQTVKAAINDVQRRSASSVS